MPIFLADYISTIRAQVPIKVNAWINDLDLQDFYFDQVPVELVIHWVNKNLK
jgi:hypothetical protein